MNVKSSLSRILKRERQTDAYARTTLRGIFLMSFIGMLFLAGTPRLIAQLETGSIFGVVQDPSGAAIVGAHVVVENTLTGARFEQSTDKSGNYVAPVLPLGTYRVTASMDGFNTATIAGISLSVGERKAANLRLQPGSVSETVQVTAELPQLQTGSSEVGTVISEKKVEELPSNGRSISSVLALLPGTSGASSNWFSSGIGITVDGTDASQIDSGFMGAAYNSGQRLTQTSMDAVQEVQVQTSNFSAQYGQSNGAIFNIVTKSGTNHFHGSLFEYLRNENTDARNYFNTGRKPEDRLNQYGGSLGGPIKRNKLFFFGNYERIQQLSGITFFNVLVPTASFRATLPAVMQPYINEMPLPNAGTTSFEPRLGYYNETTNSKLTENSGSVKVDYQITDSDKLSVRWNGNGSLTFDPFGVSQGQVRYVPGLLQTARVAYTKIFTPNLYNEASIALNRMRYDDESSNIQSIREQPLVFGIGNGGTGLGPAFFDIRVANTSYTYLDTLSWVKGRHQLKFGFSIIQNQQNKELNYQQTISFNTLDQLAANNPQGLSTLGYPMTGIRIRYNNVFAQDDIQITPRFVVNAGLRYTYDTVPREAHDGQANYNPATGLLDPVGTSTMDMPMTEFAPRLGFTYRPAFLSKTVIRGAAGVFYNDMSVAQSQELKDNWAGEARSLNIIQDPTITAYPFPADSLQAGLPNIYGLPKTGWKNTHTYQWNLAVQQELSPSTTLQLAYVGNQTVNLSPPIDINRLSLSGTRPNPNYGTITVYDPCCTANYEGLQVTLKHRMAHHLIFDVNYAWSRSMDHGDETFGPSAFQNDQNLRAEYGPADYDQRHYLEGDFIYELPSLPKAPHWLGGGWQVNGIATVHSGAPFTVICGCGLYTNDGVGRPNAVPGVNPVPANKNVPNGPELNRAAFSQIPFGTFGDVSRNSLYGPGWVNLDSSFFKNFKLRELATLQLRVEAFNTFNHPNFSNPDANINGDPNFGRSLGASAARQLQFAARIDF